MRTLLANFFVDQVKNNINTYILSGDHGYALFEPLRKNYPNHFINAGVAEQNMVGVAAGMAKLGLLPIVYGLGAFIPIRVLEQIKLDVCYEKLKVIFLGDGAGAVYTEHGISHQTFEDIACLRSIPNIKIFSPCDLHELDWCLKQAIQYDGPSYIRIGKSDQDIIFNNISDISNSGVTKVISGSSDKPVIFSTGSMVSVMKNLLNSKKELNGFSLYAISQIKPLDFKDISFLNQYTSTIITVEEHNQIGGLGSTISEIVSSSIPRKVIRIGIKDRFTKDCGSYRHAMKEHGLDAEQIYQVINNMDICI